MEHNNKLREYGAVTLMQRMLEKYAEKHNVSIDEALNRFASSKAYDALFDYDGTELWKEGPDYMLNFFEQIESTSTPCRRCSDMPSGRRSLHQQ